MSKSSTVVSRACRMNEYYPTGRGAGRTFDWGVDGAN